MLTLTISSIRRRHFSFSPGMCYVGKWMIYSSRNEDTVAVGKTYGYSAQDVMATINKFYQGIK